jgi:hypothetical protein
VIDKSVFSHHEREGLHGALIEVFPTRSELEMFLAYKLNWKLNTLVSPSADLEEVVYAVVEKAYQRGWLNQLVAAAVAHRPEAPSLQPWLRYWRVTMPDRAFEEMRPPAGIRVQDSAFFDLIDLRRIVEATLTAVEPGPIAFGVNYPDLAFVAKLAEWLPYCMGPLQRKEPLNLKPEFNPIARQIQQVSRYRRDLETTGVLCPAQAEGVPVDIVEAFLNGVRAEFGDAKNWLALIITANVGAPFPEGVITLPLPQFDRIDIQLWCREVVGRRGWPHSLVPSLANGIVEEASDGSGLDVRAVYEAIDRLTNELQFDPDGLRLRLEQGSSRANSTSC